MSLNDSASDDERQQLLPFVTRLACADTAEVECERANYIAQQTRFGVKFDQGIRVLEVALAIGRQADPLGLNDVQSRMDTARQSPLVRSRFKGWFAAVLQD